MTFDKDQTQEKPPDNPITKGLSSNGRLQNFLRTLNFNQSLIASLHEVPHCFVCFLDLQNDVKPVHEYIH